LCPLFPLDIKSRHPTRLILVTLSLHSFTSGPGTSRLNIKLSEHDSTLAEDGDTARAEKRHFGDRFVTRWRQLRDSNTEENWSATAGGQFTES
jgi:hypothetical protein